MVAGSFFLPFFLLRFAPFHVSKHASAIQRARLRTGGVQQSAVCERQGWRSRVCASFAFLFSLLPLLLVSRAFVLLSPSRGAAVSTPQNTERTTKHLRRATSSKAASTGDSGPDFLPPLFSAPFLRSAAGSTADTPSASGRVIGPCSQAGLAPLRVAPCGIVARARGSRQDAYTTQVCRTSATS